MATFAKSGHSAALYATFRPSYSPPFYRSILDYHRGPKNLCVDVGTGHGVVARTLSSSFARAIGTDPSASMIKQARSSTKETNVEFREASAEDLGFVEDGSVDLVVAGQAAHWFDYSKVWPSLTRKVRSGGTIAFIGYKDHVLVDFPKATALIDHYCYGPGKELMGMYWEQPGRNILRDLYRDIVPPSANFEDVTRLEYEPGTKGANSGTGERLMHKKMPLAAMEGYLRTFSAYINWMAAHPDAKPRKDGGKGDIVDEMMDKMLEANPEWKDGVKDWKDTVVECEWGSIILLARHK